MKKHSRLKLLFWVVVILTVLSIVPFPYYQPEEFVCKTGQTCPQEGWHLRKSLAWSIWELLGNPSQSKSEVVPTPDQTANWKTYTHPTLSYSFSYPQDASIETYDNSITVRIDPPDLRTIVGVCPRWISFSAPTSSSSTKKTQDEYGCIHNALALEQKVFVESQYSEKNQGVIDQILSTFQFVDLEMVTPMPTP